MMQAYSLLEDDEVTWQDKALSAKWEEMYKTDYERVLATVQVENAAREFAEDILRTRERALAGSALGFVELSSGRKGYKVYRRPNLVDKKRDFASAGSSALQFSSIPAYIIKFSVNGSPSATGVFVLQHEKFRSVQAKVSLQPVTGRVRVERVSL